MPSIFLCHSSRDKPFVRRLAKTLSDHGVTVWLDETKLRIGDSIVNRIADAIRDVDFVVPVVSRHSITSPWVQKKLSIALTKELRGNRVSVLPTRLDGTRMPATLGDKLYADFSDPKQFTINLRRLLNAMGISHASGERSRGLAVEWTSEGPSIVGYRATISPTESNALLVRWFSWFDKILPQEKKRWGAKNQDAWGATRVRATIKACEETYKRRIYEEDLREVSSEIGRKANLFFIFMERMHFESSCSGRSGG